MTITFVHFPKGSTCPFCKTDADKRCFLMPIAHTGDGRICEAQPVHIKCWTDNARRFQFYRAENVIAMVLP